jgi:hypothetical protein
MQYRSRDYDPGTGRFAQQDGYEGDVSAPPSLHRYAYAYNDPVQYTDPSGMNPLLIFGVPALIIMLSLYIALGLGLYHEFSHPRPGVSTASRICIGVVKGFAVWGALLPFGIFLSWLVTWAIVYVAYFAGEVGVFPIAMAYIWYYVQNHHIWTGVAFAVPLKVRFESIVEWGLEEYSGVMEGLDYGASRICGASGVS